MRVLLPCAFVLSLAAQTFTLSAQSIAAQKQTPAATVAKSQQPAPNPDSTPSFGQRLLNAFLSNIPLKLRADPPSPQAGQLMTLSVSTNLKIERPYYIFDWGDQTPVAQTSATQLTHVYVKPGRFRAVVKLRGVISDKEVSGESSLNIVVAEAPQPKQQTTPAPTPAYTPTPTPTSGPTPAPTPAPYVPAPPVPPAQEPAKQAIPPTLTLRPSQTHAIPGHSIRFTVASNPPTNFSQYLYHFGDGTETTGPNGTSHTYTRPRNYLAYVSTLPAESTSTDGAILSSREVQIQIQTAALPRMTLSLLTPHAIAKQPATVAAQLDPPDDNAQFRFNWGDASPPLTVATVGLASHIYAKPGQYQIGVTAITTTGNISHSISLAVAPAPWPVALILIIAAGVTLAGFLTHHFWPKPTPTGELHTTFGLSAPPAHQMTMHSQEPYHSLTFKSGMQATGHSITFHKEPSSHPEAGNAEETASVSRRNS